MDFLGALQMIVVSVAPDRCDRYGHSINHLVTVITILAKASGLLHS